MQSCWYAKPNRDCFDCLWQEIKVQRVNPDDKLGLTLCDGLPVNQPQHQQAEQEQQTEKTRCSREMVDAVSTSQVTDADADADADANRAAVASSGDESEVYIQDIQKDSLAAIDGRLRQGDILLQVRPVTLVFSIH